MKVPEASCYPPALSSRIKGSPLRETRKRGSEERRPGYRRDTRAAQVHCFSGGQERPRQGRGGEEGARTRGPPDSARCPLGASGAPAPPLGYDQADRGWDQPFLTRRPSRTPPPPPAGACAAHGDLCRADRSDTPSRDGKGRFSSSKAKVRAKEGLPPYEGSSSKCSETENDLRVAGARAA